MSPDVHVKTRDLPLCQGAQTVPSSTINVPATLSTWQVTLLINMTFDGRGSTVGVNVPADSSIDLLAAGNPSVPTLGPLPLAGTSLMLLALAACAMTRRKRSGRGYPAPPR